MLSHVSKRLCIKDRITGITFLVDTGADVSILPASSRQKKLEPSGPVLYAANHSSIKTYGIKSITVSLNLRRQFSWNFICADIEKAIIGADFLQYFNLLVDMVLGISSSLIKLQVLKHAVIQHLLILSPLVLLILNILFIISLKIFLT